MQWAEGCKMVQFVHLPKSARGILSDSLGESIGGGLANFTGNYFANKALDKVMNDPEMENADPSERQSKLQSALQPYGQYGENIFKKRMQIEQQRAQEKETKKSESLMKKKAPLINRALKGEPLTDQELELFTPDEQMAIAKHNQVRQTEQNELERKKIETIAPLESALEAIDEMRSIRKKGNLGRGSGIIGLAGGETAKDRGKYEQLGKSIIQYATNIPIRNKVEFETLAERLYDASITDSEAEGVLDAMEQIIQSSLNAAGGNENSSQSNGNGQKRPPFTSFHKQQRPGFVQLKDPQGVMRWVPENLAQQMQGSR